MLVIRATVFTTPGAAVMGMFRFDVRGEVLITGAVFQVQQHAPDEVCRKPAAQHHIAPRRNHHTLASDFFLSLRIAR